MKLFRIQSIRKESLWYSFDGKFKDKLKEITGQEVPMPWDDFRQSNSKLKLLSSVEDIKMFPNWFSKEQIEMLFNSGYSLFEYEVENGIYLPKGEVLFDYNKVISCKEIQKEILNGYSFELHTTVLINPVMIMKPKYLVRPDDFSIFDLDESNGCYRSWSKKPITYSDGTRPNAMEHFTLENLTKNYGFFEIDESELELYEQKCNEHYKFLSWQSRSDGHGGSKSGTYEEYLEARKKYCC